MPAACCAGRARGRNPSSPPAPAALARPPSKPPPEAMAAIPALLDSRAGLGALRRSLPRGSAQLLPCRSPRELERALHRRPIEAMLLGPRTAERLDLPGLPAPPPWAPSGIFGLR